MVTTVGVATVAVVTVNVTIEALAVTVTVAGTDAAELLLLDSVTIAPPVGAGPLRVTVATEEPPLITLVGLSASVVKLAGFTVSTAVLDELL